MIKQLSVTPPGLWSNETLVLVTNLEYEAASLPCPLVCDSVTENNPLLYICNKCMARAEPGLCVEAAVMNCTCLKSEYWPELLLVEGVDDGGIRNPV